MREANHPFLDYRTQINADLIDFASKPAAKNLVNEWFPAADQYGENTQGGLSWPIVGTSIGLAGMYGLLQFGSRMAKARRDRHPGKKVDVYSTESSTEGSRTAKVTPDRQAAEPVITDVGDLTT